MLSATAIDVSSCAIVGDGRIGTGCYKQADLGLKKWFSQPEVAAQMVHVILDNYGSLRRDVIERAQSQAHPVGQQRLRSPPCRLPDEKGKPV